MIITTLSKNTVSHPPSSTFFYTEFCNTLKDHEEKVSRGGKAITKVQFADDKDALAEEEQELEAQ